jgi:hypothetical protein
MDRNPPEKGRPLVAVVGKDAVTVDAVIWQLRRSGLVGYGFHDVTTSKLQGFSFAAAVLFIDDFSQEAVEEARLPRHLRQSDPMVSKGTTGTATSLRSRREIQAAHRRVTSGAAQRRAEQPAMRARH